MLHQRTTGLTATQFATLLTALAEHLTWVKPDQKPRRLTLAKALKVTLLSYRQNITQETLAHFARVSQPTISRTINTIEQALLKVLKPLEKSLEKRLNVPGSLVIDGTLVPTWNWRSLGKTNFSGKHKRVQPPGHLHP